MFYGKFFVGVLKTQLEMRNNPEYWIEKSKDVEIGK